jgi:ABC-type antimicrobial peptide transport system permease subunit
MPYRQVRCEFQAYYRQNLRKSHLFMWFSDADSRLYDPKYGNTYAVYTPALQDPNANYKCLVIRGDAVSPRDVQQAVESLGHELLVSPQSVNDLISRTLLRERLTAAVGGFFGLLAIALAAIGLYGLMAYTVGQGRREAGIRLALGARPGQLTAAIFRHAIQISLTGVAVGSVLGLASVGAVRTLLFGISAHDPVTFLAASLLMTSVALLAAAGPALRLGRTGPVIALREN